MSGQTSSNDVYYSVVVPVFNEAPNLRPLHARVSAVMESLGSPYEFIVVDDASTDESVEVLKELQRAHKNLRIITFLRNFGQHPAVIAGFQAARGQVVITLDADLQNPPEEIPKLLPPLEQGYDVVSGWRRERNDPVIRKLPSKLVNKMVSYLTGVQLNDYGCMLRAYKRHVVEYLKHFPERCKYITALTSWLGVKICEVPVEQAAREVGKSRYNFPKLLRMNFDLLTGFSINPIQVVSLAGIAISLLGFGAGAALLAWRLMYGSGPSGLATYTAVMLVLCGVQLLSLGMIGEYVGRIYLQVQGRPYFIVRDVFEPDEIEEGDMNFAPGNDTTRDVVADTFLPDGSVPGVWPPGKPQSKSKISI